MITVLEVVERSFYDAILKEAIRENVTVNPQDYYPASPAMEKKYKDDIEKLNPYVAIFGTGNYQSKGLKVTPRVVIETHGYYPGGIGLPGHVQTKEDGIFKYTEVPAETLDQYVDVRLVSGNQIDNRLLHNLLFISLPQRGYIKPYYADKLAKTGNIFMELVNFFDVPDADNGVIEKVYQFAVYDCLLEIPRTLEDVTPIKEIAVHLEDLIINV